MIVTIHQPNYLPYLGFFDKMAKADIFVLYDNTQFKSEDFQNRNRIRTKEGWIWLTIPVNYKFGELINQVKINNQILWNKKHWKSIEQNYSKAPYFREYRHVIEEIYNKKWENLSELNAELIKTITKLLGIKTKIINASELGALNSKATQALVDICKKLNAKTYISGADGEKYLDMELFNKAGIKVIIQKYKHPTYKQTYTGFEPNMCILDLLFNKGENSLKILKN